MPFPYLSPPAWPFLPRGNAYIVTPIHDVAMATEDQGEDQTWPMGDPTRERYSFRLGWRSLRANDAAAVDAADEVSAGVVPLPFAEWDAIPHLYKLGTVDDLILAGTWDAQIPFSGADPLRVQLLVDNDPGRAVPFAYSGGDDHEWPAMDSVGVSEHHLPLHLEGEPLILRFLDPIRRVRMCRSTVEGLALTYRADAIGLWAGDIVLEEDRTSTVLSGWLGAW